MRMHVAFVPSILAKSNLETYLVSVKVSAIYRVRTDLLSYSLV